MYIPDAFAETESNVLRAFMREHPFATLVTSNSTGPTATHLPLHWVGEEGEAPERLLGHVARGNPHWRHFERGEACLAIFHGPHAYISPSWYASDSLVPTWNYAAVHVTGHPRLLEGPGEVRAVLDRLVERFESSRPEPWVNRLETDFMSRLQAAIVAFEIPIDRIEGKFKLGQNRSMEDQQASLAGLTAEDGDSPESLVALTRARLEKTAR